ncbi:hypothetical protein K0U91_09160 [Chryseobacterium chendengshani]|uniref:hypothetical protein n=1 Tax=Chryseobacterium sp. LJ668 TaxID=2864040 RepID=UPI001C689A6B|nr:hypothetical protein [Chryseobacterium sp. LJ668]MBW8524513.1 hypothetical protein [Chryseobacterium sp. LJ668]QYK15245.1 hypothetical protein K0U91_09160 [Chryseobacterium sp. LJ668]
MNYQNLKWHPEQSPYFLDVSSNKLRELDVKARKYFKKGNYSCDVDILVECKSLKNYHIIANNEASPRSNFELVWTGSYIFQSVNKLDNLLYKHNLNTEECTYIKEKLEECCIVNGVYKWLDYMITPFEIPTFNAYRETNINNTKDIDNSVIWKCIQSLQGAMTAHEDLLLDRIEHEIIEAKNQNSSNLKKIDDLVYRLCSTSDHIFFIHPIIVVESKLWEFTNKGDLKELKYFRLNIQMFFDAEFWVDIVNFDHVSEYLNKTKKYTSFHNRRRFITF